MNARAKILLVDDEERFVDGLQSILEHYDYDCTKVLTGNAALALLQEHEFDAALLDVGLPDISGCKIAAFITSYYPNTATIMLTGLNTVETAVEAMKQGAYDFLAKPINHDQLIKIIDKALEHKRLRNDLQLSEKRFQVLAEAAWEGIMILRNNRLLEANMQFYQMFGYDEGEMGDTELLEKIIAPAALDDLAGQFKDAESGSFESVGVRRDGSSFPLEARWREMEYFGSPAQVWAVRDITERVRGEQEKLALQEKLAKANKLKALGLMAGSVAHDLNNILTAVVSYPDILLMQMDSSDKYYQEIKKIQQAGKRAAAVVNDLVSIARGKKSQTPVENLNQIITDHLKSIEHGERQAEFDGVRVMTMLAPDLGNVECSAQRIHKILLNLLGNAFEAVKADGTITIATENCRFIKPVADGQPRRPGDYVKLTVSDNGPGIGREHLERIFDPFYTTKKNQKSGTGLGLSIVWNCVLEHDGWVEVKDNQPGAVFEVYLPATNQAPASSFEEKVQPARRSGGETILLVDDQPEQNETIQKMLNSLGYKTFSVTSSGEAIAFVRSCRVDLAVLDMMMGDDINGCQIYEQMLEANPAQKAIIISGYSKTDEVDRARTLGVSQVLEKPVTLPAVSRAIRQALSGP